MASPVSSPGSPRTLYSTIQLSGPDDAGKMRRKRTIISPAQLSNLELRYRQEQWPNRETKEKLAKEIGMSTHFVNIWFQNKRSRMKKLAQEEAELAAMRQDGISPDDHQQKGDNKSSMPIAIAPKSQAIVKLTEMPHSVSHSLGKPTTPNTSPVISLKLPMCTRSPGPSPKSPLSLSLNNSKLHVGGGDIINIIDQNRVRNRKLDAAEKTADFDILSEDEQAPQTSPLAFVGSNLGNYELANVSANEQQQAMIPPTAVTVHQMQLLAQQQQQQHYQRQLQQQKPDVRYGTNPEVILNSQPLALTSVDAVHTPTCSSSVANDNADTTPTANLFDCLVAMVALEEGGMIEKHDLTYDVAVNSALYGIKVEDEMLVNYDRKKGFRFESNESDEM